MQQKIKDSEIRDELRKTVKDGKWRKQQQID